ncbi:MAG: glycosyltransferase family 2 protein [Alistipes senegalensis]|nr:glycosyltransferase family 2 protein [Bacteroides cellulosilyticus]MCM1351604.1 glycosyltransferase family 2 protein [Alistipes senegalensis]
MNISVIIPLYNKEREIGATLRSILAQTLPPTEIVVVDDGSTDRSADIVREIATESPLVRLVPQANAGECAARNRAIAETTGEYIALLDADDEWRPGFLQEIAALIEEFPDCGLYCTAFDIVSHEGEFPAVCPSDRGIVENFFRDSAHRYIAIPSASCIPRRVFDDVGGFPEGMKMGGDLYMWIKIARRYKVCFSPARLCRYSRVASNRSSAIYTPERTPYSFEELYDPTAPDEEREFIARAALGKALVLSAKGGTEDAARAIRTFGYTRTYRRTLHKVRIINALPVRWRTPLLNLYNTIAWRIAKKGL